MRTTFALAVLASLSTAGCLEAASDDDSLAEERQPLCDDQCPDPDPGPPPPPPVRWVDLKSGYTSVLSPQTFLTTTWIPWNLRICNAGNTTAAASQTVTSLVVLPSGSAIANHAVAVPSLGAGQCYSWTAGSLRFGSGDYAIVASIDNPNVIAEANEGNNGYTFMFRIR